MEGGRRADGDGGDDELGAEQPEGEQGWPEAQREPGHAHAEQPRGHEVSQLVHGQQQAEGEEGQEGVHPASELPALPGPLVGQVVGGGGVLVLGLGHGPDTLPRGEG